MRKTFEQGTSSVETSEEREPLQWRILGPLEVRRGGERVDLGPYKQRALLALLLIDAGRVVSTDRIIDELWTDSTGKDPQNALWVVVSRLRTILEPDRARRGGGTVLLTRAPGYLLSIGASDVDAARFEGLVAEGRSLLEADPATASLVLGEALSLWHGRAFEEFSYESFAQPEIARLEELRLAAVEDRMEAELSCGRARELVGELWSLVRQHPVRERLTSQLMVALYRSGRQADALRAFATLRTYLAEELGLEPSRAVTELEERILLDDASLRAPSAERARAGVRESGLSVRGYELRGEIGSGHSGSVHRAYQPTAGREVAIKIITPDLADDADFIRRFEAEAATLAAVNHPHIAPLLDYWREPDAAYVVTQRFAGGSLDDAVAGGLVSVDGARRIVDEIGGALAAAHRRGIVHGALKPSNVLLNADGHAFVTDFVTGRGPAVSADSESSFAAPELHRDGIATASCDLYSLGALAEFTVGRAHGPGGLDRVETGPVGEVLRRAQARLPGDRYADVDSFVRAFDEAFGKRLSASLAGPISNPYRGLQAFSESDAGNFFGRERLVERLLARLGDSGARGRLVVVVGPSGSGKSSVVRAGLLPALRQGAAQGSEGWFIVKMTPGRHPFDALAGALLTIAVEPPHDLRGRLETGISETVRAVTADPAAQVVLVVDQLEELFTHTSPTDAAAFLGALSDAARHPHSNLRIVATLRADFYDHPLRHRDFGELLRLGTEVIVPMSAEELVRAVELPASSVGVGFEQGLVSEIVAEMAGQPSALPLLQHALTELFDQRIDGLITFAAHRRVGGVSAALGRRADQTYLELDADQQNRARDLFLRLVTIGEDSGDTRRRVLVSELADAVGCEPMAVLDAFGRNRLLAFDRDPVARTPTVEIAHEALLTEWVRMRHWIADARLDVQAQRRLSVAATEWAERGEDPDFLLAGGRLQRYGGWTDDPPVRLTSGERTYLVAAEEASRAEELAERRRVRRLRRLVAGVSVALVIAVIAGAVALVQRRSATVAADRAELANLVSRSAAVGDDDPELALLLALEAHRRSASPETEQAVLAALGDTSIATRIASVDPLPDECVGFSTIHPVYDGMLEFATVGGRMLQRDPLNGAVTDLGPPPGPCSVGASFNGITAAVAPDLMRGWFGSGFGLQMEFDRPTLLEWITEDRFVLRSGLFEDELDEVAIHDITTGQQLGEPIVGEIRMDLTYDPAARRFAISFVNRGAPEGEGQLFVVDAVTGEQEADLVTPSPATSLAFDEASGHLVAGFPGGRFLTVEPSTGAILADVVAERPISPLDIEASADQVLTVVSAGGIDLVDRQTGATEHRVDLDDAVAAAVRPDGLIVTIGPDGRIDIHDIEASAVVRREWIADPVGWIAFNDGRAAILDTVERTAEVVDLTSGERFAVDLVDADGHAIEALVAYPEPDGVRAVTLDHELVSWRDGTIVEQIALGSGVGVEGIRLGRGVPATRFGDRLAVLGRRSDGVVETTLVELRDATAVLAVIETPDAFTVLPSSDGGVHAVHADGLLVSYDLDGVASDKIATGQIDPFIVALDPSGRMLALGSEDGGARVVDLADGTVETISATDRVTDVGFGPDGRLLAIRTLDGSIRLWDTDRSEVAGVVWPGGLQFTGEPGWYDSATDSLWMAASGRLIEIPVDPQRWVDRACEIVGRDLTSDEWDRYVPGDRPLRSACA